MKRLVCTLALALLLTGCGADWFPEHQAPPPPPKVTTTDVGALVAVVQVGPADWTITTTRGVFVTYTSLSAPVRTAVELQRYSDAATGLVIGKVLRALQQTILVKDILALVE